MAQITIWTATTDGDECPLTTTAHGSEQEMLERVRSDLRHDILAFAGHEADAQAGVPRLHAPGQPLMRLLQRPGKAHDDMLPRRLRLDNAGECEAARSPGEKTAAVRHGRRVPSIRWPANAG